MWIFREPTHTTAGALTSVRGGVGLLLDLLGCLVLHRKPDLPTLGLGRDHELSDGFKDYLELLVVLALQIGEFAGQPCVRSQQLPESHEGPYDFNVDLDGTRTPQDAGEHRHALLGEGVGRRARPPRPTGFDIANCDIKPSHSSWVSGNMKSSGKRSMLRFTASLRRNVSTSYSSARSRSSITLRPRMRMMARSIRSLGMTSWVMRWCLRRWCRDRSS